MQKVLKHKWYTLYFETEKYMLDSDVSNTILGKLNEIHR